MMQFQLSLLKINHKIFSINGKQVVRATTAGSKTIEKQILLTCDCSNKAIIYSFHSLNFKIDVIEYKVLKAETQGIHHT